MALKRVIALNPPSQSTLAFSKFSFWEINRENIHVSYLLSCIYVELYSRNRLNRLKYLIEYKNKEDIYDW